MARSVLKVLPRLPHQWLQQRQYSQSLRSRQPLPQRRSARWDQLPPWHLPRQQHH